MNNTKNFSPVELVTPLQQIRWEEAQARIESEKMALASDQIFSAWEISRLISTLQDGQFLGVTKDGQMFVGTHRPNKVRKIGKIVPKHVPSNFDTAAIYREVIKTTSFATPAIVMGFKSSWEYMIKTPKNHSVAVVDLFVERLEEVLGDALTSEDFYANLSYKARTGPMGTNYVEVFIKDWKVSVTFSDYGEARAYTFQGITTEI